MNNLMQRPSGIWVPDDYRDEPRPQHQLEFFAYETVGMAITHVAAEPVRPFWWLPDDDYLTHEIVAYIDQYDAYLMDHVEDLLMRIPDIDDRFDYESDLQRQREVNEARIDYYDKLGL